MKKYVFLFLSLLICSLSTQAQTISVSAPSHVPLGENFQIAYTIIGTQAAESFRAGNVPSAIEVVVGPYTSSQSNFQMVNGHTSSSSSVTYTYTCYAAKNGTYTIPAAHARVGNKTISSRAVKITISGTSTNNNSAPRMHGQAQPDMRQPGTLITGKDLFIKVSVNKNRVYEQEPIVLTYKVYTDVDITYLNGKMPDMTGFHTQEIAMPEPRPYHMERVNGRDYQCITWSQYVMYPQMTGKLEIPSITFEGMVGLKNNNVDPIEALFNGGSGYVEVKRNIIAPSLTIQVDPLPKRPTNFSGGVGMFSISAQLNKTRVATGNPVNLRAVIGGVGNMKLIKQPVIQFPKDFDTYDAKVTDRTRLTANGVEGNMIYDFLVVPQNQGKYTIPAIAFTYYDTNTNQYRTLHTKPFTINVSKGDGNVDRSGNNLAINQDIHTIKTGDEGLYGGTGRFFGSVSYWSWLVLPLILFFVFLVIFRKRANADMVEIRGKNANRVASKRLKKAKKLIGEHKQDEFFDEVLRALWGYVGDKLNMPVEKLSRENIVDNLLNQNVNQGSIDTFVDALDECEFERYAPGNVAGNMNKTFNSAMTAILNIEDCIKHNKKPRKIMVVFLLMLLLPLSSYAVTKQDADFAYKQGSYQQAIKDYKELLRGGASASLYYNLGNAYYRSDSITKAILSYERALKLSPGDNDIRFNLQFANSKTIDKVAPNDEVLFVTWYKSVVNYMGVDRWATLSIISIILCLSLFATFLFNHKVIVRKTCFYASTVFLAVFVLSTLFAYQQKQGIKDESGAVVIAPVVTIKNTPSSNGTNKFVIHEGTHVNVVDDSLRDWKEITLDDGRGGWIQASKIEGI